MTAPSTGDRTITDDDTYQRMTARLRICLCGIAAGSLLLAGEYVRSGWHSYDRPARQLVALGILAAVLAAEVALLTRRHPWTHPARVAAVAAIVLAQLISLTGLPDHRIATQTDWVFGTGNWLGLMVLFGTPLRVQGSFLAVHWSIAAANLLSGPLVDTGMLRFATGSVGTVGYPLCLAITTVALRRICRMAATARREMERVAVADITAAELRNLRRQRFADLDETIIPLLEGLRTRWLSPDEVGVRRACAIAAGRLRRLFAESDTVDQQLLHELRHCAGIADRRGVLVELDAYGRLPVLPLAVRRDITEAPLRVLATAKSWARVTVVGEPHLVSVSVVADSTDVEIPPPATPQVAVELFHGSGRTWVEVRWTPTPN
ncbi:hypothetical protein [Plantactinospora soyae]|uniref:Uncharacterized protein n=1 Tax=Plantactinospora soyae TaxID=1544732 RepID=A0A927R8Z3_9ACTN|nr:hypothetical protein [Plantactinospora soyae]MBE1489271.1 hypothetical protein [Plantactinospora soyae]